MEKLKILCVDDEPDMQNLVNQVFRKEIKNNEFQFFFALNGVEALTILDSNSDIYLVLADINMPIMDGLTLLKHIKALSNPLLKVIMVSAYGDMQNIRHSMNNGAFDFANKPIDFNDLRLTIQKSKAEIEYLEKKLEQSKRLKVLEADLQAGAIIQNSLLPKNLKNIEGFPMLEIDTIYEPARFLGGDFYDVFHIDENNLGFLIADVSGKGVPAASFMLICHTAIKIYACQNFSPSDVMKNVNQHLIQANDESMFVTVFFAIFNKKSNQLKYVFAGHNKPFMISKNSISRLEGSPNVVLGVVPEFDFKESETKFSKGDKLLMFTDGIVESINMDNQEFGEKNLDNIIRDNIGSSAKELNMKIIESLNSFTLGQPVFDDLTILTIDMI